MIADRSDLWREQSVIIAGLSVLWREQSEMIAGCLTNADKSLK